MKKVVLGILLFTASALLNAQNTKNDEVPLLRKQVRSLKAHQRALEKKVRNMELSAKVVHDTLTARLNQCSRELWAVQDSLESTQKILLATRNRTDLFFHSLKLRKHLAEILIPLLLVFLIVMFWIIYRKIQTDSEKQEALVVNTRQIAEEKIAVLKKEFEEKMEFQKAELEGKIAAKKS